MADHLDSKPGMLRVRVPFSLRLCGEMADTLVLGTSAREGVWVRLPPGLR